MYLNFHCPSSGNRFDTTIYNILVCSIHVYYFNFFTEFVMEICRCTYVG